MKRYLLIITYLFLSFSLPLTASQLSCQSVFSSGSLNTSFLAPYSSFNRIKDSAVLFASFQKDLKAHKIEITKEQFQALFKFTEKSNKNYIKLASKQKSVFFRIENSEVKNLNDMVWDKSTTTHFNFYFKTLLIKNLLISSAQHNNSKVLSFVWKHLLENKQNDFKGLSLYFPESKYDIIGILSDAYTKTKREVIREIRNDANLYNAHFKDPDSPILIDNIINAVYSSELSSLLRTMTMSRISHSDLSANSKSFKLKRAEDYIDKVHKEIQDFYRLHNKVVMSFAGSEVLRKHEMADTYYFSAEFFGMLRKIKVKVRDRDANYISDNQYYVLVAEKIEKHFGIKLNYAQVRDLVDYYHNVQSNTPQMLHTKTEPNTLEMQGNRLVISSDIKNAGGLEMSNVSYFLLATQKLSTQKQIAMANLAVEYTTSQIQHLFKNVKMFLQNELDIKKIEISGDDLSAETSTNKLTQDISNIATVLYAQKNLAKSLRNTVGYYKSTERSNELVEWMEKTEKEIVQEYSLKVSSSYDNSLKLAMIRKLDGSFSLLVLNKNPDLSVLNKILKTMQSSNLNIQIEMNFSKEYSPLYPYNLDVNHVLNKVDYIQGHIYK